MRPTALVTGRVQRDRGAFARELAAAGTDLVLVARHADRLEAVRAELTGRCGVAAEVLAADLLDPAGRAAVEARLADPARPVDVLVNGAGLLGAVGALALQGADDEEVKVALNVTAVVRLTNAVLPGMVRRGRGRVVNIASMAAFMPSPGGATYSASKAFVTCFSRAVHEEVGPLGVHVTVVCPGATRTAGRAASGSHRSRMGPLLEPDEVARRALAAVGAGRPVCVPGGAYRVRAAIARHCPGGVYRRLFQRGWRERTARSLTAALTVEADG
ncbi:hypothetical protein BJF79_30230 [Actinomadura sp. CNU-125]|uniref:SDR family NAD(P)-dependent oxidoreductase n=1 Tax=Actinomadura sp. CNU-125 TaxID=1904961 RepID=UPI000959F045|nr:SDR family NAD(P)-dependent oxidoreductase [Actinomadura sp. CNU-125]OLT37071.1 hypothetical protein BJF79_30230 [Actinomadura sp. CNU-125]